MAISFPIRTTSPAGQFIPYYMTTSSGGLNSCIQGNGALYGANVLNNCTGFSQGRMAEIYNYIHGTVNQNPFTVFSQDAHYWYNIAVNQGMATGQTPQIGAVGVYVGMYQGKITGHVCNVEQFANGRWEISESHYNYPSGNGSWDYSYLQDNLLPAFIGSDPTWELIGFIYPFGDVEPVSDLFVIKKNRKHKKHKRVIVRF